MTDADAESIASREGWYTAVTRCTRATLVLGRQAVMTKQARRAELPGRKTFLLERLMELDHGETVDPLDTSMLAAAAAGGTEDSDGKAKTEEE
jgi:hypothetical protein